MSERHEIMPATRIEMTVELAARFGGIDGAHHKTWVIDQMVRALCGCSVAHADGHGPVSFGTNAEYAEIVRTAKEGVDGPETYPWDEGIAP